MHPLHKYKLVANIATKKGFSSSKHVDCEWQCRNRGGKRDKRKETQFSGVLLLLHQPLVALPSMKVSLEIASLMRDQYTKDRTSVLLRQMKQKVKCENRVMKRLIPLDDHSTHTRNTNVPVSARSRST
ncbi:hypothetical protein LSAT2_001784 [Lamellibrachia satsuma]|nr:hypothetical protein LSAT2_001784 [Lamellibrachia satsuma]